MGEADRVVVGIEDEERDCPVSRQCSEEAGDLFRQALALWRGPALADLTRTAAIWSGKPIWECAGLGQNTIPAPPAVKALNRISSLLKKPASGGIPARARAPM